MIHANKQTAGEALGVPVRLTIKGLSKSYGRHVICRNAEMEFEIGQSIAVIGPNGSGKTTLINMIAGLTRPDSGSVTLTVNGDIIPEDRLYRHIGLVSPDLALYGELTALENLQLATDLVRRPRSGDELRAALDEFGLARRGDDSVSNFSTGMKQRLKYCIALIKDPALLLLDEPTANLDEQGSRLVWDALSRRSLIVVLATNNPAEAAWAGRRFRAGPEGGMVSDG